MLNDEASSRVVMVVDESTRGGKPSHGCNVLPEAETTPCPSGCRREDVVSV